MAKVVPQPYFILTGPPPSVDDDPDMWCCGQRMTTTRTATRRTHRCLECGRLNYFEASQCKFFGYKIYISDIDADVIANARRKKF